MKRVHSLKYFHYFPLKTSPFSKLFNKFYSQKWHKGKNQKITNSKLVDSEPKGWRYPLICPRQRLVYFSFSKDHQRFPPPLSPKVKLKKFFILYHSFLWALKSRALLNICLFLPWKIPSVNVGHIITRILVSQFNFVKEFPNVKTTSRSIFKLPDKSDLRTLPLSPKPVLLETSY